MFAPTRIWRRWHRRINVNERRYAVVSALAASAITSLVLARGHRIDQVSEIPLVVDQKAFEAVSKTKTATQLLTTLNAFSDVEHVKNSHHVRSGKGKWRNRRFVQRRGPLIVFNNDRSVIRPFQNIPGIEVLNVHRLNLLQLAPGGNLGRFIIWFKDAFEQLDNIFGTFNGVSREKHGYYLPRPIVANPDLNRIVNSTEVQSKLRYRIPIVRVHNHRKNPLKNKGFLYKLNPYAKKLHRQAVLTNVRQALIKEGKIKPVVLGKKRIAKQVKLAKLNKKLSRKRAEK